ncbi:MAG TPA: diacylglycerol kinase family protein [Chthoniobacterales bacterium]
MNKQKVAVIFNPAAKGEKARFVENSLRSVARNVEWWATDGPGQALELARRAAVQGSEVVVAVGGDGTINEVVNGIAGSPAILGVLPVGTMNVFAYELGLPQQQIQKCWEVIEQGKVKRIDLPSANHQYFVQLAGVGLDAQAVEATDGTLRRSIGPFSYLLSAAQVLGQPPPRLEVRCGGGQRFEASFVLIGNGRHYGGPFPVFTQAANDDGLLDVLAFRNQGYADMFRYLQGLLRGKPEQVPDIEYVQTASVLVSSNQDTPVEVDGEVSLRTPVRFGLSPQPLRVLVP